MSKVTIELDAKQAEAFEKDAEEVQYVFHYMEGIMKMLHYGMSDGFFGDQSELISLFAMLERAMLHAAENEGERIANVGMRLKKEMKDAA